MDCVQMLLQMSTSCIAPVTSLSIVRLLLIMGPLHWGRGGGLLHFFMSYIKKGKRVV